MCIMPEHPRFFIIRSAKIVCWTGAQIRFPPNLSCDFVAYFIRAGRFQDFLGEPTFNVGSRTFEHPRGSLLRFVYLAGMLE